MKCLPSEIVKGLSSPRPPEPRKLLLVQFTFEPVHDDVVDASGIEELQELLAACFQRGGSYQGHRAWAVRLGPEGASS